MQITRFHTITKSEHSRGYIYLSNNKRDNPWISSITPEVTFLGQKLGVKSMNRGRIIVGKSVMQNFAQPGMKVMISISGMPDKAVISKAED